MPLHPLRTIIYCLAIMLISASSYGFDTEDGQYYKLTLKEGGIYEISGQWLNDHANISLGSLSLSQINILAIPGGALQESSHWQDTERLRPLPLRILDDGNGILDKSDRVLFYVHGASVWTYDTILQSFDYTINPYTFETSVILHIGASSPSAMDRVVHTEPQHTTNQYMYRAIHHEDKVNLLGAHISNQGSGQRWFGEELTNLNRTNVGQWLPDRQITLSDVSLNATLAVRSGKSEQIQMASSSHEIAKAVSALNTGDIEGIYARTISLDLDLPSLESDDDIVIEFFKSDQEAKVWLDFLKVEGITPIAYSGSPTLINNVVALAENKTGLLVSQGARLTVWEVTDPFQAFEIQASPSQLSDILIATSLDRYQEFLLFDETETQGVPTSISLIVMPGIMTTDSVDMVIIYPSMLAAAAQQLAAHRESHSNMRVETVDIDHIYNQYAAGRQDPTTVRNFLRDLYRHHTGLSYALLFGDASYDYRHINKSYTDQNLVPTFETQESLDPLLAFPSDDYFALLDDGEDGLLSGDLDIAVGRITARNLEESLAVVAKIVGYDGSDRTIGSWRSRVAFVADDEDNNLHINDADRIAEEVAVAYPLFDLSKIYLDAFLQVSTPGGNRYPTATQTLNQSVNQGVLILNYLGHGGPNGWAQERVLRIDDINQWSNRDRLPLIITATCSFTGFDDPELTTAGEAALLQPNGGAIALLTTVRSVYASKNFRLTQAVFRSIFEKINDSYLPIGEVMRSAKNSIPNDNTNARKFFMIGDPSLKLNIPSYQVNTTSINERIADDILILDTVGALDIVTLTGEIQNGHGDVAHDFEGQVDITVYDKPSMVSTLANDRGSFRKEFRSRNSVIYKGKASVTNGLWETSFRVPVDIDYAFGQAKISYYALSNHNLEAMGHTEQLAIAGTSERLLDDTQGPEIGLYLNDRDFTSGSVVSPNNLLIVDLQDDSGINLSNASIGHEITASLDNQIIVLNDYYNPSQIVNGGSILYDIKNLAPGDYELEVRAFDVVNNVSTARISFTVSSERLNTIKEAILYPNPTSDRLNIDVISDIRGNLVDMELHHYNILGQLLYSETVLAAQIDNIYRSSIQLTGIRDEIRVIMIQLRDRITGIETVPIFKKAKTLK